MSDLSEAWSSALADFEHHLGAERNLSAHSVRAYLTDLTGLAEHSTKLGIDDPAALTLRSLRSWLAKQQRTLGAARASMARRAAAARTFTAWAHTASSGLANVDAGAQLASPKSQRGLPYGAAAPTKATASSSSRQAAISEASPHVLLRDLAMLELLYATGMRVRELGVSLNVDDLEPDPRARCAARQGRQRAHHPHRRASSTRRWTH